MDGFARGGMLQRPRDIVVEDMLPGRSRPNLCAVNNPELTTEQKFS